MSGGTDGAVPDGNAIGRAVALYRTMLRIRRFEEAAEGAHAAGELPGALHLSIGQEAVAAGVAAALDAADMITSTHRGHGHAVAKGAAITGMMAELLGRATGTCHGKGGSMHIADFAAGMLGANGVVAGGIGIAVGAAQGLRLLGRRAVVACFFGDGAINRGPFLEGLNWAAIFRLPVLFVCEDNQFAAFTRTRTLTAGGGAAARAEALGVPAEVVDGNDALAVADAASRLVSRIRDGRGPMLLQARTYRLRGHTVTDKGAYRDPAEHARQQARDPIARLGERLAAWGVAEARLQAVDEAVAAEIAAALAAARAAPWPAPCEALSDVQEVGAPA